MRQREREEKWNNSDSETQQSQTHEEKLGMLRNKTEQNQGLRVRARIMKRKTITGK
jgi:hypothetical protein